MEKPRLESVFHVSESLGGGVYIVGRVVRLESSGKILGVYQGNVIIDRKKFGFLM